MALPYDALNPNVASDKGERKARFAPLKPLLLLSLFDMVEEAGTVDDIVEKTPELRLRFDSFFAICQRRWGGLPGLDQPFFHLKTQEFWQPLTAEGHASKAVRGTEKVRLSEEFKADLLDPQRRDQLRRFLVETWFPENEQRALFAALGFTEAKIKEIDLPVIENEVPEGEGRTARFRVTIVAQYRFTCALTGYGLRTCDGYSLVEAAHIKPHAKSRDNNPGNGLALTQDAHWMFDNGLWSIADDLTVMVAKRAFTEWGPMGRHLSEHDGRPLNFEQHVTLRPAERYLRHHRERVFKYA